MFGNLKIPLEIEESVINSIKAHKYNGYGPSTGKRVLEPAGNLSLEIEESVINSKKAHKYNGYGPSTGKQVPRNYWGTNRIHHRAGKSSPIK